MANMFIGLMNNSILLFSIGLIYILLPSGSKKDSLRYKFIIGVITGIVGLIIMSTQFVFGDGLLLDTRSVLLSMSGVFFGAIPTLIAALFTSVYRFIQGGNGAFTGILVIFVTGAIGIWFGKWRLKFLDKNKDLRHMYLLAFGFVVHLVMLLCFLTLGEAGINLIKKSAIPILLIYPFTGLLLGLILFKQRDVDRLNQELIHISTHDYLTGLHNRGYFEKYLESIDVKDNLPISVIIGDVNGLKLVNDSLGHKRGDQLLVQIANLLKEAFPNNMVARWGGDEYVIVLPKTNQNKVEKLFNRTNDLFVNAKNIVIPPSISMGYYTKTKISDNMEDILRLAEERMYRTKLQEGKSVRNQMINTLEATLLEKSIQTEVHAGHMAKWGMLLAEELKCDSTTIDEVNLLSRLHDIGKIGISDKILLKPKRLSTSEWVEIKKHPEIGYRILNSVHELSHISEGVLHHHERWDGSGYPSGLKGDEIPYICRIISIVDAFEVMINGRPYKEPMTMQDALVEIRKCAGTQFDPMMADTFIKLVETKFM